MPYQGPVSDGGALFISNNVMGVYRDADVVQTVPLSLEIWYWPVFIAGASQDFLTIVTPGGDGFSIGRDTNGKAHAFLHSGTILAAAAASIQQWHHLVLSVTAAGGTLYEDAVSVGTVAAVETYSNGVNVMLGAGSTAAAPARFSNAVFAEAAVYPIALTAAQVTTHFVAANAISTRPTYRGLGTFDVVGGEPVIDSLSLAAVLASVRKVY
jgi:hypothetical protein